MVAPTELLTFLTSNQLLSPANQDLATKEFAHFPSSELILKEMVQRGWLTAYQQTQILAGHGAKLILGPYRLIQPLGEGGMGMVFKAIHPRLDRLVALKFIRPQVLAARPEILTRFHREARAIAQLNHPNVVILFDADEIKGTHYIAMEYVDGLTLEKLVHQNGPMAIKQACDYMRQSALGLQHAMDMGLVHRDIKPSNILVANRPGMHTRSSARLPRPTLVTVRDRQKQSQSFDMGSLGAWGQVKILDMGLARLQESLDEEGNKNHETPLTRAGALLGTPDFIAPEQARDARSVDIRADLYSLGCTFYYILTSRPPFPGGTDVQKLIRHQTEKPYPIEDLRPTTPSGIIAIVNRLLAKRPEDRYSTPQHLVNALEAFLSQGGAHTTPVPVPVAETPPIAETPIPMAPISEKPMGAAPMVSAFPASSPLVSGAALAANNAANVPLGGVPNGANQQGGGQNANPIVPIGPTNAMQTVMSAINDTVPFATVAAHTGVVGAVSLSPNGQYAASAGIDGRVRVWDISNPQVKELATFPRPGAEFQSLTFSPDGLYIVAGGMLQGNARIWRWDWQDGRVFEWATYTGEKRGVGAMTFSSDGSMFAAGVDSIIYVMKVNKRVVSGKSTLKGHSNAVRALAFSPNKRLLVSAGEGKNIRIWAFGWLGLNEKAKITAHSDIVTSLTFSPDGKRLVTSSLDRTIGLWDPYTPSEDSAQYLTGHTNNIRLVHYLPDCRHLISIGESGQVSYWDVATANRVQEVQLSQTLAACVAISQDGTRIISGSTDGKLIIFQLAPMVSRPPLMAASK